MTKLKKIDVLDILFCLGILLLFGIVLYLALNPSELSKRNNNRQRIRDGNVLVYGLERQIEEASTSAVPFPPNATGSSCVDSNAIDGTGWVKFNPNVINIEKYTKKLPQDPQSPKQCYEYRTSADGKFYQIIVQLENDKEGSAARMVDGDPNKPQQTLKLGTLKEEN